VAVKPIDVWKEFDRNLVTHSAAHHIVAIAELRRTRGYARVSDVAKLLNITRGSASLTLKTLKQKGFVVEDENRFLRLSEKGRSVADAVVGRKYLIRRFFCDVLDVPDDEAVVDTCKIEHLIGYRTTQRLAQFLRFIESDDERAEKFLAAWRGFDATCEHDPDICPACHLECVRDICEEQGRRNAAE
jgi:DtxR family Mn-dependent transcriptional regulator